MHFSRNGFGGVKIEKNGEDLSLTALCSQNAVPCSYSNCQKGTVEWYRFIYMNEGLKIMIEELTTQFKNSTKERLNGFVQAILYGYDSNGKPNDKPPKPNSDDIAGDYDKYKFEKLVYARWVNREMNKGVGF